MSSIFNKPQYAVLGGFTAFFLTVLIKPTFYREHLPRFLWKKLKVFLKLFGAKSDVESYLEERNYVRAYEEILLSKQLIALQDKLKEKPIAEGELPNTLVSTVKKIRQSSDFNSRWQRFALTVAMLNLCKQKLLERKKTKYDEQNTQHERELYKLWDLVGSGELEGRMSQQWVSIGFQGENPATDFRGGGILSLENLIYFAQKHKETCLKVRDSAQLSKVWYCFAITGINITGWVWELINDGLLDKFFISQISSEKDYTVDNFFEFFSELYCLMFVQFDVEWKKFNPKTVMEFGLVQNEYLPKARKEFASLDPKAQNVFVDYLTKSGYQLVFEFLPN